MLQGTHAAFIGLLRAATDLNDNYGIRLSYRTSLEQRALGLSEDCVVFELKYPEMGFSVTCKLTIKVKGPAVFFEFGGKSIRVTGDTSAAESDKWFCLLSTMIYNDLAGKMSEIFACTKCGGVVR